MTKYCESSARWQASGQSAVQPFMLSRKQNLVIPFFIAPRRMCLRIPCVGQNPLGAMNYSPSPNRYDSPAFYRRCGRSGIRLPLISFGLWHNFGAKDPYDKARAMVCRAFDRGVTHFDLANNYGPPDGAAEETFGANSARRPSSLAG